MRIRHKYFRRSRWLVVPLLIGLLGVVTVERGKPAHAEGAVADHWSPAGIFRTAEGWYASPIHANVLADGDILFIGVARPTAAPINSDPRRPVAWIFTPPALGQDPAPETTIREIPEPLAYFDTPIDQYRVSDDLYCAGTALDADGRVISAGGTRTYRNASDGSIAFTLGLPYETALDPSGWHVYPGAMVGNGIFGNPTRWYPTVTRLPDARMLVTGGQEVITNSDIGYANRTVETLDPATGARTLFSDRDRTPESIQARDYTHAFVLPYEGAGPDLLLLGEAGVPVYGKSTAAGSWVEKPLPRPGNGGGTVNWGASSAMLPIRVQNQQWGYTNGSVVVASGDMDTPFEHRADVYDVTGSWRNPLELTVPRHHPSTVLLPDSRVLVVNGHDMMGDPRVQQAQYIDPANAFSVAWGQGSSGVVRGYHSVAALLPDGRVLVAGGRDVNTKTSLEKPTYQIYTPDYVTKARPGIMDAPATINYGTTFNVISVGPRAAEVQLIGLASMTHSFDAGQRAIQLPIGTTVTNQQGGALSVVGAPSDSHVAPPGYYLMYVLDANRVPSVARIVKVA